MNKSSKTSKKEKGVWPLPKDRGRMVPSKGSPGSFWEDRQDRRHCGVDLYADPGSKVVSIEEGLVLEVGIFTSPQIIPYWNETSYVLVENEIGLLAKFSELVEVEVRVGDRLSSGQMVGQVGSVLNPENIDDDAPAYIKRLKDAGDSSMLHFELYRSRPRVSERYLGGNWFGHRKPEGLLDPTDHLVAISEGIEHSNSWPDAAD